MNVEFKIVCLLGLYTFRMVVQNNLVAFYLLSVFKKNLNELKLFVSIGTVSACGLTLNTKHYGGLKKIMAENSHLEGVDLQAKGRGMLNR